MALYGSPDSIRLEVYANNGRSWPVNERSSGLVIETATPGGELSITFDVNGEAPYADLLALPGVQIDVYDLGGRFRHYRLEKPSGNFDAKSADLQIVGRGWSSHAGDDKFAASRIYPAGMPIEDGFRDARNVLCPLISPDDLLIRPTGAVLKADTEDYAGKSAKSVWNALAPLGPVLWHVWGQDSGLPLLEVVPLPIEADYIIPLTGATRTSMAWDLQTMFNRVMVKYSGGFAYADDFPAQREYPDGVGCRRTYYQDMSQSISSEAEASALAYSLLAGFAQLPPEGLGITVPYGMPVYGPNGELIPIWRLQAGKRVMIDGLPAAEERLQSTFIVQQTTYDDEQRATTLMPLPEDIIGDILKSATQQSVRVAAGPVTVVTGGGSGSGGSGGGSGGGSVGPPAPTPATTVQEETSFDLLPDIGEETGRYARERHTHGSPGLGSLFTAKGDMLVATGPGTYGVLPVGPPGSMLFADPAEPFGMRWDLLAARIVTPPPVVVEAVLPAPSVYRVAIVTPPPIVVEAVLPVPVAYRLARVTPPPMVVELVLPAPVVTAGEPGLAALRAKWRAGSLSGSLSNNDPITTLSDESGNSRSIGETGSNRPAYKAGSGPNGLDWIDFATGKWLETTVNDVLPLSGAEFVVFCLFKGGGSNNIVWGGGTGTTNQAAFIQIQGTTGWRVDLWNNACSTVTSTLANWQLATFQIKAGTARQWLNGVQQSSQAKTSNVQSNHFLLGRLTTAHFESFNGGIVECRVYGALTDTEIDDINDLLMTAAGL